MRKKFLILGQGLAGTCLSWQILEQGSSFLIADKEEEKTSSRIAAGMISPLSGKKLHISWEIEKFYPYAIRFYRNLEKKLNQNFLSPLSFLHLFLEENEKKKWDQKKEKENFSRWVLRESQYQYNNLNLQGTELLGAKLSCSDFLETSKAYFKTKGYYQKATIKEEEIEQRGKKIIWKNKQFDACIDCRGISSLLGRWFQYIPHRSSFGEIFKIHLPQFEENRCLKWTKWLLPEKEKNIYLLGATYRQLKEEKCQKENLILSLKQILDISPQIISKNEGIRPIIRRSQPLIGWHSSFSRLGFFNSLGSKGAGTAPLVAFHFANHLCKEEAILPQFSLEKWLNEIS